MGNYEQLKQSVSDVIKTNGNQEITGSILQNVLLTIISTVGANATFAGAATPTTNPGTPDGPVFYLASEGGTYTNFNAIELQDGLSVLSWNGSWSSQQIFAIDDVPTVGSDNLVKSGGVYAKIKSLEDAGYVFVGVATPTTDPGTPDGPVFYLASEGGTYTNFNAIELQGELSALMWNGSWNIQPILSIDDKPTANSDNLVKSGGIYAKIKSLEDAGYAFAGIATPTTNPDIPDQNVFYIASEAGIYTNFGGAELQDGLSLLMWNGSWSSKQILSVDDIPTAGSDNLVKSGGVQEELALGAVYDVSAKNPTAGPNNDGKWEPLSALLEDANLDTLIPTSVRKGGMSIKFVQSSDNKYVQYRLMANTFTTDVTQWQGVDDEPIMDSQNITKSNGVAKKLAYKKVLVISNLKEFATRVAYNVNVGESYRFVLTLGQAATGDVNLFTSVDWGVKQSYNTRDAGVTEIIWEVGITENAEYVGVVMANYATLGAQAKCEIYKLVPANDLMDEEVGDNLCLKAKLDYITVFATPIPYNIQIGKRYKMTLTLPNASVGETNLYTAIGSDIQEASKYNNAGLTYFEWEFFATKTATSVGVVISDVSMREGAVFCFYEAIPVKAQVENKIEGSVKRVLISDKIGFYEPSTMMVNPLKAGQKYRIELSLGGATSNNVAFGTARSFIENAEVKQWSTGGSGTLVWDNFIPAVNVDYFTVYIQDYSTIGTSSVLRIYQYFDNDMKENSYNLNYFNNISQIKNKVVLFLGHSLFGKDYNNPSTTPTGADEVCERMNGYNGNIFLNYAWGGSDWAENTVYPSVLARYKEATENSDSPLNASVIDSILICQGENGTTQLCIGYDAAVELAMSADPESVDPKNGHIVTTLKYIAEHSPQARIYLVKAFACNIPGWTEENHIQYRDALRGYCDVLGLIFIDGMLNTGIHKWIEADANTRFYTVDGTHPYTIAGKRRQISSIMKTVFEDFNTDTLWNSFFLSKRR